MCSPAGLAAQALFLKINPHDMSRVAFVLLLATSLTVPCAAQPDTIQGATVQDTTSQGVRITVDPRIELMGVVQLLTDYPLVTDYASPYRADVRAYFAPLKDRRAARLFEAMDGEGFAFDAVPKAMLSRTAPPALTRRVPYPERSVTAAGGADSLRQFMAALRGFAQASDVQAFYRAHQGTYQALVDSARGPVGRAVGTLRDYLGTSLSGSVVVLGPLLHDGGFAARYEVEGKTEAYALIGPSGTEDGVPTFGPPRRIASLTWHEFSHTVVNPLTRQHWDRLKALSALLDPISKEMKAAGYGGNWETVVSEHVIRAIEVRLSHRQFGAEAGKKKLAEEEKKGFRYVAPLARALKRYEQRRDRYPTLADFYPQLVEVFETTDGEAR